MANKSIPVLAALLLLGSAAAWYWWPHGAPAPVPAAPVTAPIAAGTPPPIANPVPSAPQGPALPALADSDAPVMAALQKLPGASGLENFLQTENIVRRVVATIDNLPRHKLAVEIRPLKATSGAFMVTGADQEGTQDERNAARYTPLVAVLDHLDMRAVSSLYQHYYPLFQRAYQDLGYPHAYFNDRLVTVIDHLLATPRPGGALALVRPKVFWEYADPELEARSAGQKLMLRLGTENAAVVARKLRELRALVATGPASGAAAAPTNQ